MFRKEFKEGLEAVFDAQFNKGEGFAERFLANTTKVAWQADRSLWQPLHSPYEQHERAREGLKMDSQLGVVPIFGGISWTDDQIRQVWYPSNGYQDKEGVVVGAYNFQEDAFEAGNEPIKERLKNARQGAKLFGKEFGKKLEKGVAIAWQNMPYIRGGWSQWGALGEDSVRHFNQLIQGTAVFEGTTEMSGAAAVHKAPTFFIIGDQVSSLSGWQEGAIYAALNAISRLTDPSREIPYLAKLPDTRLTVEGV